VAIQREREWLCKKERECLCKRERESGCAKIKSKWLGVRRLSEDEDEYTEVHGSLGAQSQVVRDDHL